MSNASPALPHGPIINILPDIFMVTGTNITEFNGTELQHSRNMIIIRENGELSLINTVRLSDEGLAELEALGKVKHVIRIGAFHGRDDGVYVEHYGAKYWALEGLVDENIHRPVEVLRNHSSLPFSDSIMVQFISSKFPEAVIYMTKHHGVLISCDSIKNWLQPDEFFSSSTAELYQAQGFFGKASISSIWLQTCQTDRTDFEKLNTLSFKHLLSAHGEALLQDADVALRQSIHAAFDKI